MGSRAAPPLDRDVEQQESTRSSTKEALVSQPKLPFALPLDHLHVTRWDDPLIDALGHDVRSPYVERFWLPLLGPSTMRLFTH